MSIGYAFLITKNKKFTYKNEFRLHIPKNYIFFIPKDKDQVELWKNYLCETFNRSYLYLHECYIDYSPSRRKQKKYRENDLLMVLLRHDGLNYLFLRKTVKIFSNTPVTLRYMPRSVPFGHPRGSSSI